MHIITQFGGAPSAPDFRLGSLVLPAVPWDSMGKSVAISWSLYKQEVGWLADWLTGCKTRSENNF